MFLSHLRAEKAPALTRIPLKWQLDADFAHFSVLALSRMAPLIDNPQYQPQTRAVLSGWPGIVKWCSYMYDARIADVDSPSAQHRRALFDSIAKFFYALSHFNKFEVAMVKNPGCLELVAKLWAVEDIPAGVYSGVLIMKPTSTRVLADLFQCAHTIGKGDTHQRVLNAAGGNVDFIVQLVLGRVKKATKTIDPDLGSFALRSHIDLIGFLCRPRLHPLRQAFFDADVIAIVTNSFVALSRIIVQNATPDSIMLMAACINFLGHYLEGGDYLALVHAIKAGFLPAFLDCSPVFSEMAEEDVEEALNILLLVLPQYLIYRSFIEGVMGEMEKLKTPHYEALIAQPRINRAWCSFVDQLDKRRAAFNQIQKLAIDLGSRVICDYVKCERVDVKNNFKKCSACQTAYYCSPNCQKLAWKLSHRALCKGKQKEREGHREKGRPKRDIIGLHALARWTANVNSATFHAIAERAFPDTPHGDLMPCIDFLRIPEEYSVEVIKPGAFTYSGAVISPDFAAHAVSHYRTIPDTIVVQSIVPTGATV
ncbi:hypothetical protein C8R45DRAFT_961691 [Mycena sanguinolenta]|nr:hypothetical protein C8R45DRAFT_961691 [Mycena sanguinolenta]